VGIDREEVSGIDKQEKERKRPTMTVVSRSVDAPSGTPILPSSGSSFPYVDRPTSLKRGEGHLMVLELRGWARVRVAMVMVVVGMRARMNQDQRLILDSNSAPRSIVVLDIDVCEQD